ncbi:MAG: hypothetical protein JWN74_204 [Acidobacteriaceae bacterium]|jgi:hypothetical protein|nr:hypothetical protein [Acidobacteriaceae bacterium]
MNWLGELVDLIAPALRDRLVAAVSAFRKSRRKERNRFVLRAIATEPGRLIAPLPGEVRYDLATIDRRVYIAQMNQALGDVPLFGDPIPSEHEQKYRQTVRAQRKLGLPDPRDPDRSIKIEAVLREMEDDGLLAFHPPNMWIIR